MSASDRGEVKQNLGDALEKNIKTTRTTLMALINQVATVPLPKGKDKEWAAKCIAINSQIANLDTDQRAIKKPSNGDRERIIQHELNVRITELANFLTQEMAFIQNKGKRKDEENNLLNIATQTLTKLGKEPPTPSATLTEPEAEVDVVRKLKEKYNSDFATTVSKDLESLQKTVAELGIGLRSYEGAQKKIVTKFLNETMEKINNQMQELWKDNQAYVKLKDPLALAATKQAMIENIAKLTVTIKTAAHDALKIKVGGGLLSKGKALGATDDGLVAVFQKAREVDITRPTVTPKLGH